mmetsp:Transcript_21704/g.64673  ORF Transcript_21704/g.64673 Transcript_21704/m.64673 type:complete len:271 (+) Transcript_21704:506-1318(+)
MSRRRHKGKSTNAMATARSDRWSLAPSLSMPSKLPPMSFARTKYVVKVQKVWIIMRAMEPVPPALPKAASPKATNDFSVAWRLPRANKCTVKHAIEDARIINITNQNMPSAAHTPGRASKPVPMIVLANTKMEATTLAVPSAGVSNSSTSSASTPMSTSASELVGPLGASRAKDGKSLPYATAMGIDWRDEPEKCLPMKDLPNADRPDTAWGLLMVSRVNFSARGVLSAALPLLFRSHPGSLGSSSTEPPAPSPRTAMASSTDWVMSPTG